MERAWRFTTLGYGHDLGFWRAFVGELRSVGYDGVLSVEHEDPLAPIDEALERSVEILKKLHLARAKCRNGLAGG